MTLFIAIGVGLALLVIASIVIEEYYSMKQGRAASIERMIEISSRQENVLFAVQLVIVVMTPLAAAILVSIT